MRNLICIGGVLVALASARTASAQDAPTEARIGYRTIGAAVPALTQVVPIAQAGCVPGAWVGSGTPVVSNPRFVDFNIAGDTQKCTVDLQAWFLAIPVSTAQMEIVIALANAAGPSPIAVSANRFTRDTVLALPATRVSVR